VGADIEQSPITSGEPREQGLEALVTVLRGDRGEVGVAQRRVDLAVVVGGVGDDLVAEVHPLAMTHGDLHGDRVDVEKPRAAEAVAAGLQDEVTVAIDADRHLV
jgi:hypothetical protein